MSLNVEKQLAPADRGLQWVLGIAACILAGSVTFGVLVTEENGAVLLPAAAIVAVWVVFVVELQRRTPDDAPLFDLGMVFAGIVAVYALYPLISFLASGMAYTEGHNRLYQAMPTPVEIGRLAWYHCVFLAVFAGVYLASRGTARRGPGWTPRGLSRGGVIAIVLLFAVAKLFLWGLGLYHDMSFESYSESYVVIHRLPLFLRQVAAHTSGVTRVLAIALLYALFRNYRKYRWIIWGWMGAQVALTFLHLGARTVTVTLGFSAVMMYHYLVRPIRWGPALGGAAAAMALFLSVGALRSAASRGEQVSLNVLSDTSEFDTLFGNAYDLYEKKQDDEIEELPEMFYFADFVSLVPQQFLPFRKVDAAMWYLEIYYPAVLEEGGGLCFGIVAESIVGFGLVELAVRGAILALLLAMFSRRFMRRRPSAWTFIFQVWLAGRCYMAFRNTTFSLLPLFVWSFLPVYLFVKVAEGLLPARPDAGASAAGAVPAGAASGGD